jgi:5-amino-6-(5-phosphoribosylamino)uracil reductase
VKISLILILQWKKLKSEFQIETIILEGGGVTNGEFLSANLVDEISPLILPFVVNNEAAPRVFDKVLSEHEIKNFELREVQQLDRAAVWLRYKLKV